MTTNRTVAILAILVAAIYLAGCGGPQNREVLTFSYDEIFAEGWTIEGFEAWRTDIDLAQEIPTYSDLGAYPIGNGHVFGIASLSVPFGTVEDIFGPHYQRVGGMLGAWVPAVLVDNEPVTIQRQWVRWIAPGGLVHSRWEGDTITVDLLQTVPRDLTAVTTMFMVTNAGDAPVDVSLGMQSSLPTLEHPEGDLKFSRDEVFVRAGFAGARTSVVNRWVLPDLPDEMSDRVRPIPRMAMESDNEAVICSLGPVDPQESVGKIGYIAIGAGAEGAAETVAAVEERGWQLFEDTHAWWRDWHERTLIVEGAGEKIDQFMAIQKYICRVQQADAGGYSPMHKYSYRWIRDSNGPIMFLLDSGDFDSVNRDLSYHYAGCAQKQEIFNNIELILDVDPDNVPEIDWSEVPTQKAESGSFLILQNYWYHLHTGETEQLEERWDYLRRAFDGHEIDDRGRLLFHGDETYRFPGYQMFGVEPEAVADYVHMSLCSADSGFKYVAAAEAMAEMAGRIGRPEEEIEIYREAARWVREMTEQNYWQEDRGYYAPAMSDVSDERYRYPFANINMRPTWIGYAEPDEQQRRNITSALRYLYRPEAGTSNLTPTCGYTVGMTPGMVLSGLTSVGHPEASQALRGLLTAAEASGGFSEMNRPDDMPSRDAWGRHRVRPWEGGINGSAVLQFLTGFEPDAPNRAVRFAPNLPDGSDAMTVRNLRVADANLTLQVERAGEALRVRITCEEAEEPLALHIGEGGTLAAGETLEITVPALPTDERLEVADEPFDYGPADVPAGATVLLTWSAEVVEQVRATEDEVVAIDTRIAWPVSYLRSALLNADGSLRAPKLITDIEGWPGAFKVEDYWTEGEGAELLAEYESAGGVVEPARVPAAGGRAPDDLIN